LQIRQKFIFVPEKAAMAMSVSEENCMYQMVDRMAAMVAAEETLFLKWIRESIP